ncbi:ParA family protein [Enterococcus sp. LJL90]
MAKKIAVSTNKGGALKTSITTNLGGVFANAGFKVLLMDLDNQGNIGITFGINPDDVEFTIYDILTEPNFSISQAIINVSKNLDIIVANDDMAYLEMDVLTDNNKFPDPLNLLQKPLKALDKLYDFIIIDTPPAMGMISANVFNSVEDIIIPYHPEVYSFRSMVKSIKSINNFKKTNNLLDIKAVVPVKVRNVLTHEAFLQSAAALCEQNGITMTKTQIPESIKYAESIGKYKRPVTLLQDTNRSVEAYKEIYLELMKELNYIG